MSLYIGLDFVCLLLANVIIIFGCFFLKFIKVDDTLSGTEGKGEYPTNTEGRIPLNIIIL